MKSIIEREATFKDNSSVEVKVRFTRSDDVASSLSDAP